MKTLYSRSLTTQMKFAKAPYVRNLNAQGSKWRTIQQVEPAELNKHGLESRQWYMCMEGEGARMSPWHDIELSSMSNNTMHVSGVIEITANTNAKLECVKELAHNPIMQDVTTDRETGELVHRNYVKAPKFNYGFIPQTWCNASLGGDNDALDLVDLSQKALKPAMAVSDYMLLGCMGLIDQGELDVKVLAIEVTEAKERGIRNLNDYER